MPLKKYHTNFLRFDLLADWKGLAALAGLVFVAVTSARAGDSPPVTDSGIYAASETVPARRMNASTLTDLLSRRNYQQVTGRPSQAGQFQVTDEGVAIITRDFVDEHGNYSPKMNIVFHVNSGRIDNKLGPALDALHLEPLPLASSDEMFISSLKEIAAKDLNISASELSDRKIFTFIVPAIQQCGEQAVGAGESGARALVAIDLRSRSVFAWAETKQEPSAQSLVSTPRPLGGKNDAFVYLTALDGALSKSTALSPLTPIELPGSPEESASLAAPATEADARTRLQETAPAPQTPRRTLREVAELLLPEDTAALDAKLGATNVERTLELFGVKGEASLLSLTAAFAAIASGGAMAPPKFYSAVIDRAGKPGTVPQGGLEQVASPVASFVLTDMLRGTVNYGALRALRERGYKRDIAGAGGASEQGAWLVGFTPFMATGVWGATSPSGAIDLWLSFMSCIDPLLPNVAFTPPAGVQMAHVDRASFQLAGKRCPRRNVEQQALAADSIPLEYCSQHERPGKQSGAYQPPEPQKRPSSSAPRSPGNALRNFWRGVEQEAERVLRR